MEPVTAHPVDPRARDVVARPEPLVWSFVGDSVTAGEWHTWGGRAYPELVHERLRELDRRRDGVVDTAVSGWRVTDVAADLDVVCLRYRPDVVVVGTGLNDTRGGAEGVADFVRDYRTLVERIRAETEALVVVQTPNGTLPTAPEHVVAHLPAYADAVRQVAADTGAVLVDHARAWEAAGEDSTFHWLGHGCHPNAYGHRAMARTFLEAFGMWDPSASRTCRLTIP